MGIISGGALAGNETLGGGVREGKGWGERGKEVG